MAAAFGGLLLERLLFDCPATAEVRHSAVPAAAHAHHSRPPACPRFVQVEADINRREAQLFTNWLEEARRHAAEEAAARRAAEEEEKLVGPAAPAMTGNEAFQADYGTHLLPGEGEAMAAYVQVGWAGWLRCACAGVQVQAAGMVHGVACVWLQPGSWGDGQWRLSATRGQHGRA